MNGLDRLQKEIDALTYNARTVLNALIRSVTAAGNNKGFKAVRAGETIYLSRIDIYRIYKFYEEWAVNDYATESVSATETSKALEGFDTILIRHDQTPVSIDGVVQDSTATTTGLIKHSKILFKNSTNTNNEDASYWLDLIKNHNNAKLVSNSAPIPLNLRTPIFDANLSTKHYNSYPTYLFPMNYFNSDTLGFSGDNTDHNLDGNSWTIGADDFIRLESQYISLGKGRIGAKYKTIEKRTGKYALSFGSDCHAQAEYSIAGGRNSMVPSNTTNDYNASYAIAIGNSNIASDEHSTVIGGYRNSVSNTHSAILGGNNNAITAKYSAIIGGSGNVVGGAIYSFRFPTAILSSDSGVDNDESELGSSNKLIMVQGDLSEIIFLGDKVTVHDFRFKGNTTENNRYYNKDGSAITAIHDYVDSVAYESTPGSPYEGFTLITLRTDIPQKGNVTGGKISVIRDNKGNTLGKYSAAIGYDLIVEGSYQLVVGRKNKIQRDARFIVGVGNTSNSFEVYDNGFISYATKDTDNTFATDDGLPRSADSTFTGINFKPSQFDILMGKNRLRIFKDVIINSVQRTGFEFSGLLGQTDEFSIKADNADGINIVSKSSSCNITLLTGSEDALSFPSSFNNGDIGILSSLHTYVCGKQGITVSATGGPEGKGVLNLAWDNALTLTGDTWGTLPTDSKQYSHYLGDRINTVNTSYTNENWGILTLYKTGFYRVNVNENPLLGQNDDYSDEENAVRIKSMGHQSEVVDYHLLNLGYKEVNGDYKNLQMFIGADPDYDNVHIGVRRGKAPVDIERGSYLVNSAINGSNIKYIGWQEDVQYEHLTGTTVNKVDFGTWSSMTAVISELVSVYAGKGAIGDRIGAVKYGDTDYSFTNDGEVNSVELDYTKINNTIFFKLRITIDADYFDAATISQIFVLAIRPDTANDWSRTFLPIDAVYPTFVNTHRFRQYGASDPWWKIYTCQPIANSNKTDEFRFLISVSADKSNVTSALSSNTFDSSDNGAVITFNGSYQTAYDAYGNSVVE